MTIHLPEELARFIHDAVRTGRYAREDDVIRDAVSRLRQTLQEGDDAGSQDSDPARQGKALTKQEFHRHLVDIGLMNQVPESASKSSAAPVDEEEEILSERMIRERLIEWLAGFI
jgi:putative addiction module CopG family antidote